MERFEELTRRCTCELMSTDVSRLRGDKRWQRNRIERRVDAGRERAWFVLI